MIPRFQFVVGLLLGITLVLFVGEIYARARPPADLQRFLGDRSPLSGGYKRDPVLQVKYESPAAFRRQYQKRLDELGPMSSLQPTWAWFGNSFVQATGMLGDTAQSRFPKQRMFFLRRNELLAVRVAQVRLLLAQGLRPQRIFFILLPIDIEAIARWPVSKIFVNRNGAITYNASKPPPPFDALTRKSALAMLAWIRGGGRYPNADYRKNMTLAGLQSSTRADLTTVFGVLGELSRRFDVPITIGLLPNREQIFHKVDYRLQDALGEIARLSGLDVFDARSVFDGISDTRSVFLPDWHFSSHGNQILFQGLLDHLTKIGVPLPQ